MIRLVLVLVFLLAACSNEQDQPATQQQTAAPTAKSMEQTTQEVKEAATAVKETAEQAVQQAATQVTEQATKAKAAAEQAVQDTATKVAAAVKSGETIYLANCKSCHANGLLGAPKLGDPRLQTDLETLVMNSIKGVGRMPARGGVSSLSDADVRAAVTYMVEQSK